MQPLAPSLSPERKSQVMPELGAAHKSLKLRSTCRCDHVFQLVFFEMQNGRRKSMRRCRTRASRPLRLEGVPFRRVPLLIRSDRTSHIIRNSVRRFARGEGGKGQLTVAYITYMLRTSGMSANLESQYPLNDFYMFIAREENIRNCLSYRISLLSVPRISYLGIYSLRSVA